MKVLKFSAAALSAVLLVSCTGTLQGISKDVKDTSEWAHGRPSAMERILGAVPTGYHGPLAPQQETVVVQSAPLKAPPKSAAALPAPGDASQPVSLTAPPPGAKPSLVWNQIDNYDAANPGLPGAGGAAAAEEAPQPVLKPVKYNDSVSVYNVDAYLEAASAPAAGPVLKPSGALLKKVFFDYGSAKIAETDRRDLRELGKSLVSAGDGHRLNVIGHASERVDGVDDPVKRKVINFEMALKRANAVTHELRRAGLKPAWVLAVSKGDKEPNRDPGDMAQEAADRRVEVYMDDKQP